MKVFSLKHCAKRKKMLLTNIFSFYHYVFKSPFPEGRQNFELFGNGLTHYHMTNFDSSKLKEFADDNFKFDENGRKLSKREENTVTSNFSFSHGVFKRLISKRRQKVSLFGNGLTLDLPIPNLSKTMKTFLNIIGKEH